MDNSQNKEIDEGNELIVLFMGANPEKGMFIDDRKTFSFPSSILDAPQSISRANTPFFDLRALKYHKSWDWLMPVVRKFDYLVENDIIPDSDDFDFWCDKIEDSITRTYEIEPCFKIIVEAIQWHNKLQNS